MSVEIKLGDHFDLLPPEIQIKVLDIVYAEIWNSDQDLPSKIEASKANHKKRQEIIEKMNKG